MNPEASAMARAHEVISEFYLEMETGPVTEIDHELGLDTIKAMGEEIGGKRYQ